MSINARTVGTVRERERELHFSNRKCSIVQQSDTHTHTLCLVNKKEKSNKVEKYKQERNLLKR